MTIEELPDIKAPINHTYLFRQEPLLEYVWEVALEFIPLDKFHPEEPDDSLSPCVFANRYAEKNLTLEERYARNKEIYPQNYKSFEDYKESNKDYKLLNDSFKERFLNNEDLQNTMKAFGLDVGKFWYLLLFVYDYIEDIATDAPIPGKTLREDINDFCKAMENATEIILKKNNRQSYKTDEIEHKDEIIKLVNSALDLYIGTYNNIINSDYSREEKTKQLKEKGMDYLIHNSSFTANYEKKHTLDVTYKKFLFNEMFQYFLKDKVADKSNDPKVSKDRWIFVSRLIYTVKYENIEGYNDEYDKNYNKNHKLQNLLRRYNKDNFPRFVHNYYW